MPGQICHDEHQVAKFLVTMRGALSLFQLINFLAQLVEHLLDIWPIKANPRRTLL